MNRNFTLRRRFAVLTCAAIAVMALYLAVRGVPEAVPEVTFVSLQGEKITTASLRGKVTLVSFWATDCVPCREEMPQLVETYERYRGEGLELIAVAMRHDPPNYVLQYTERNRLPFKVALDPLGDLARAFGDVRVTPTLIVIDKRGRILQRVRGEADFAALRRLLERELAQAA